MTPNAFRAELERLALSQGGAARVLGVTDRTVRRWLAEEIPIPRAVGLLLPRLSPTEAAKLQKSPKPEL